jgi:aminoglycoside phosphotransferase (APT) family kinase protein
MPETSGVPTLDIPADPRLSQLALALDVQRMGPLLPLPEGVLRPAWQVEYIRYKPETNCLVLYQASGEDGFPLWAYAKVLPAGSPIQPPGSRGNFHYHPDLGMILAAFPNDLEMPALRMAHNGTDGQRILSRLIASKNRAAFQPHWGNWAPIRYKPERRCVLQGKYDDPREPQGITRSCYARFYAGPEAARTAAWHRHLAHLSGTVRVPRLLGYSPRHRVLLVDRVRGRPLRDFLGGEGPERAWAIESAALALARWHRLPPPPSAPPLPPDQQGIRAAANAVATLLPEAASMSFAVCERLTRENRPSVGDPVLLHGDFYYDQVLLRRSGVTGFLDLDELGLGQPVHDVACFCSQLFALAVQGGLAQECAVRTIDRFVETYQRAAQSPVPEALLRLELSSALLKLAPMPFRRFDRAWRLQTLSLLRLAEAVAGGAVCF